VLSPPPTTETKRFGKLICGMSSSRLQTVWDLGSPESKTPILTLPHGDWVTGIQFDEESLRCASGPTISTYYFRQA
jgi:hypothetical protein